MPTPAPAQPIPAATPAELACVWGIFEAMRLSGCDTATAVVVLRQYIDKHKVTGPVAVYA